LGGPEGAGGAGGDGGVGPGGEGAGGAGGASLLPPPPQAEKLAAIAKLKLNAIQAAVRRRVGVFMVCVKNNNQFSLAALL
jgi:hypothetical protein